MTQPYLDVRDQTVCRVPHPDTPVPMLLTILSHRETQEPSPGTHWVPDHVAHRPLTAATNRRPSHTFQVGKRDSTWWLKPDTRGCPQLPENYRKHSGKILPKLIKSVGSERVTLRWLVVTGCARVRHMHIPVSIPAIPRNACQHTRSGGRSRR